MVITRVLSTAIPLFKSWLRLGFSASSRERKMKRREYRRSYCFTNLSWILMEEESQRRHKRRCGLTSHKLSSSTTMKASEVCQKTEIDNVIYFYFEKISLHLLVFKSRYKEIRKRRKQGKEGWIHPNLGNSKKLEIVVSWKAVTVTKGLKRFLYISSCR